MADKDITITYEALFELLRREKDRADIQKLSETFYEDILNYLQEKLDLIKKLQSETETQKTQKQIENIKRMMTELYERRERKIIDMAINRSRIDKSLDISILLAHERDFFQKIVALLQQNRKDILNKVLAADMLQKEFTIPQLPQQKAPEQKPIEQPNTTKKVMFLHPVPSFVGRNLEVYGPFEEQETAELPLEIASILITKGRATELNL